MLLKSAIDSSYLQKKGHGPLVRHLELWLPINLPFYFLQSPHSTNIRKLNKHSQCFPSSSFQDSLRWQCYSPYCSLPKSYSPFKTQLTFHFSSKALFGPVSYYLLTCSDHFLLWTTIAFLRTLTLTTIAVTVLPVLGCTCEPSLWNHTFLRSFTFRTFIPCHNHLYTVVLRISLWNYLHMIPCNLLALDQECS